MPTVKRIESFQHRVLEVANAGVSPAWVDGIIDSSAPPVHDGNEITFDPSVVRTPDHAVSLKMAYSATLGVRYSMNYDTPTNDICISFYFRTTDTTNPAADKIMALFASTNNGTVRMTSSGFIQASVGGGTSVTDVTDVADGNWHRVDARYNVSTTSGTLNLQVDGVDVGTATGTVTVANITALRIGSSGAEGAYDIWYSDYIICAGADHPLGDHFCGMAIVGATGTHNPSTGAFTDQAGASTDAALLAAIDDAWDGTTPNLTQTGEDYDQQTANAAAGYLEYLLATLAPTLSTVWNAGIRALFAAEDATTACNGEARLVDSAGTTLATTGLVDPSTSATIYNGYKREATAAPSGGWSQSTLEACKIRFGFSTDAAPDVAFNAVMVEYVGILSVESPIEVLIAANHVPMGQSPDGETMYMAQYDDTAEQSQSLTVTVLDATWVFSQVLPPSDATTPEIIAAHDIVQLSDYESLHMPRAPPWDNDYAVVHDVAFIFATRNVDVTDAINVTVTDTSVREQFESIEGLVAANYTAFQGDVEAQTAPTWDEYQSTASIDVSGFIVGQAPSASIEELVAADPNYGQSPDLTEFWLPEGLTVENEGNVETAFIFADRLVDVSDSINVTVDDTSQVDEFETIEGLVVAGYSTFYGTVEAEVTPTWDEYLSTTSLDVTWFLAGQAPPAAVEELVGANYTTFQGSVEPLENAGLTVEDYSNQVVTDTSFLSGIPVSVDVSDAINVTVDDQATVQQFEGIVGLVAANYSVFYGTVEAFQPSVLTIEDYSVAAVQDVAYIFATINVSVTESINVVVDDTSTLTQFETIEGLVAAGYSTFQGSVEALFPSRTTIEDHSSGSHDVSAFIVLSGPPTPPQPWGPFEAIVDDYTYTAVVDILETTSSDDVYQPIEPEEGG
jgi:preprotein translocase subunit Sss1